MGIRRSHNVAGIEILRFLRIIRRVGARGQFRFIIRIPRSLLRLGIQSIACTYFGWLQANLQADFGELGTRAGLFEHSDWALQTLDPLINTLTISLIILGQLLSLALRARNRNYKLAIGFWLAILAFSLITYLLVLRIEQLSIPAFKLNLTSVDGFCAWWIAFAILTFPGTERFRKQTSKTSKVPKS